MAGLTPHQTANLLGVQQRGATMHHPYHARAKSVHVGSRNYLKPLLCLLYNGVFHMWMTIQPQTNNKIWTSDEMIQPSRLVQSHTHTPLRAYMEIIMDEKHGSTKIRLSNRRTKRPAGGSGQGNIVRSDKGKSKIALVRHKIASITNSTSMTHTTRSLKNGKPYATRLCL